jgi:hypothetical protein
MTTSVVLADNFYQNTNPFPTQDIGTPKLNNIYETEPAIMNKEQEVAKKANAKWWNRLRSAEPQKEEIQAPETPAYKMINEGVVDGNSSFVVFPAK